MNDKNVEQRKQLRAFANRMEQVLAENDHKGGWEGWSPGWLLNRAEEELQEAAEAFTRWLAPYPEVHLERTRAFQKELLDAANFCMMAWDQLEEEIRSKPESKG